MTQFGEAYVVRQETVTKITSKFHFIFYAIAVAGFAPVGALQ